MKKIQMVDVVAEYEKYSSEINKQIFNVLKSGCYIKGKVVSDFEQSLSNYLQSEYVISCGNGTDALYIALMSLNLQRGDEVLVPTFTFVSTVEAVCLLGLKPVFLDIDKDTFLLNEKLIENKISSKTRAIIPVHLFGQCCNMDLITSIAKKHNLFIVEDAAQSIGSQYTFGDTLEKKFSGTIGDIGITSFYPSKNLGCFGDGGAIFTNNSKLANRIQLIANHGQREKYTHEIIGLNSRLDALQAAVLSFKLTLLNQFNDRRKSIAKYYNNHLSHISWINIPKKTSNTDHIFHQYSILLNPKINRDHFQKYLLKKGVPTMIYYPTPLHKQQPYISFSQSSLPISEMVSTHIISLPIHPQMDIKQMEFICNTIENYN
tara:strand:- start:2361 stop:3485 length:1125 start_codon:yes stop_codon:yes gene_type:complete